MLKTTSAAIAAAMMGLLGAGTASAAQTSDLRFVGTPSVRYNGSTVAVVTRLNQKLANPSRAGFIASPALRRGERIGRSFGGNPPGSIGRSSRHCYVAEAARPEPRSALRNGAHWELGISAGNKNIVDTTRITLKHERKEDWERAMARRLGCYSSSSQSPTGDDIVDPNAFGSTPISYSSTRTPTSPSSAACKRASPSRCVSSAGLASTPTASPTVMPTKSGGS